MRLIVHIFRKDVRHLWWGIAIALLTQSAVAWLDARGSGVSDQLSLLLIVTWAVLLALAVHEDPLVSDRQFWITRPARWRALLGSKLLFALAVVHVPSLLSDVLLLTVRGFRPWEWLGSLLLKQFALAAFLTLPVIALAAMLPGFPHLALAVIAIVGLTSFASSFRLYSQLPGEDITRLTLVGAVLVAFAVAVIPWQFARRRTWPSRLVGIAGVLIAELVLGFLSPIFVARVRAAADPIGTRIEAHVRPGPAIGAPGFAFRTGELMGVAVPLNVSGIPRGMEAHFTLEPLDLIVPGGRRFPVNPVHIGRDWLLLNVRRELFDGVKNSKVELKSSVPVMLYRIGSSTSMALGASGTAPGVGRCSSEVTELPGPAESIERSRFLQAECESPGRSSLPPTVRVHETAADNWYGRELDWISGLGLSPFQRSRVSFALASHDDPQPSWKLEFTPDIPLGWQVVNLDLRDLQLRDYVSQPGKP